MESERLIEDRIEQMIATRRASRYFHALAEAALEPADPLSVGDRQHVAFQHEFAFVVSGQARVQTAVRDFVLSPGDLLLIGPGVDHAEHPADPTAPYVVCWCALDKSYAIISHTNYTLGGWQPSRVLQLHGRTHVQSLGVAIGTELSTRAWGWQRSVRALLQYLGCILIRRVRRGQSLRLAPSEAPAIAHDPVMWEVVQRALEYCRGNFERPIRVSDVAQAVGYSTSRLSHLFASYAGETVADHVRGLRLAQARDLLEHTDYTIADIARRVGYSDPAHFTRAFVRSYGLSPNTYRRQLGGQ